MTLKSLFKQTNISQHNFSVFQLKNKNVILIKKYMSQILYNSIRL